MKIIVEILKMPDDEPGIKRLLSESASMLAKLNEVALPRTEQEHYGKAPTQTPSATAAAPSHLAAPTASASSRSPSPSATSAAIAAAAAAGPVPTVMDYQKASIPELRAEMLRRKEGALEELDDRVVTSDNANDFIKVGGLEPLLLSLLSTADGVRWRAAQALSTIVQNNPKAQLQVYEHNAIQYLVPLLVAPPVPSSSSDEEAYSERWTVVVKALTALSALVRSDDQPVIRGAFMTAGGFQKLSTLLHDPNTTTRVQTKIFTFLKHIFAWFPNTKAQALADGTIARLVQQIGQSGDINHREACLRALVEFAKKSGSVTDQAAAKDLRAKSLGLKEILAARAKQLKTIAAQSREDKDMVEEEVQLVHALTKACKF